MYRKTPRVNGKTRNVDVRTLASSGRRYFPRVRLRAPETNRPLSRLRSSAHVAYFTPSGAEKTRKYVHGKRTDDRSLDVRYGKTCVRVGAASFINACVFRTYENTTARNRRARPTDFRPTTFCFILFVYSLFSVFRPAARFVNERNGRRGVRIRELFLRGTNIYTFARVSGLHTWTYTRTVHGVRCIFVRDSEAAATELAYTRESE